MDKTMLAKYTGTPLDAPHPAAVGIEKVVLDPIQIDCVTATMLSILDNQCKLDLEEQLAWMAIYPVVRDRGGKIFDNSVHQAIDRVREQDDPMMKKRVHELHEYAEQHIPKPVMSHFKRFLAESLHGFHVEAGPSSWH
jgi:hypothetical protein